jgi:hypothetical protein
MSKAYATAMVAGDLAPAAGSGHASYQDGWPVVAVSGLVLEAVHSPGSGQKQDPDGYPVQVIANANGGREVDDYRQLLAPLPR